MADRMYDWCTLPSEIIVEIFSYLNYNDRLSASIVCTLWRECLFHPMLFPKIALKLEDDNLIDDIEAAKFLSKKCGRFVKEVYLSFDHLQRISIIDFSEILYNISCNMNLKKFIIQPTICKIENDTCQNKEQPYVSRLLSTIEAVIRNSRKLSLLSLGCLEELVNHSENILYLLRKFNCGALKSLHLSSIKEDPDKYMLLDIQPEIFESFYNLHTLSIDFDYLCDDMINIFAARDCTSLKHLELNIHGIDHDHPLVSDSCWYRLVKRNPKLEVGVTLLHSTDPAVLLMDVLSPSIPLHHFRSYFTWFSDDETISWITNNYYDTLQTFTIIESLNESGRPSMLFVPEQPEHPLVMLLWQCKKLKSFTVIGYEISADEVIAFGRLRGPQLIQMNIPECCVSVLNDENEADNYISFIDESQSEKKVVEADVSQNLQRHWKFLKTDDLPLAVVDPQENADATYLPSLLELQLH